MRLKSQVEGSLATDAHRELESCREAGVFPLCMSDSLYPQCLRELHDPPLVLYCRGNSQLLAKSGVGIVGARYATAYGYQVAGKIAQEAVLHHRVVVSGGAAGVDTAAHRACFEGDGQTICIVGHGLGHSYPAENRKLFQMLGASNRALMISEFPYSMTARKHHFPQRNRLIAGLSQCTVVVEATRKSGALITAQFALDYGKDVYAVPGAITSPQSEGTNRLLAEGAAPLIDICDFFETLGLSVEA